MTEFTADEKRSWALQLKENPLFAERLQAMKNGAINAWITEEDETKWPGLRLQVLQALNWDGYIEECLNARDEEPIFRRVIPEEKAAAGGP